MEETLSYNPTLSKTVKYPYSDRWSSLNELESLGIDKLYQYCTPDAAHDSYAHRSRTCCLEGTRTMYIQGITDWAISSNESRPRLFWMWGPAGVGKTAIAQSCAREATTHGVLGATFFFSRDNGMVSPTYFFTTIAYQLALQFNDYKAILGVKIQHNPAILTKGLGVQLQELIIAPFLELEGRNLHEQPKTVFIDGLDECGDESAQAEMVELVTSSVAQYGNRIPLLWAFFSRPERHIERTFSRYSASPLFWLIKLPITHNDDPDIRLFFRTSLKLPDGSALNPSSRTGAWPSEEDLSTLVRMVAGLFIYAAIIVKYIMDPNALSPQRQLRDVLSLYSDQMLVMGGNEQDSPLAGLDAFYRMVMSRVPEKILPIVQQILLVQTKWKLSAYTYIARDHKSPPVRLLANLFGLSLQEFENCFSKLRSVLTFEEYTLSGSERRKDGWPGSLMIVFYHASFLEFLRDPRRSGKYWIEDRCHWSSLVVKGLRLLKGIYAMNGLSQDKKIRKLRKLLPVGFGEIAIPDEHFRFRDELCFDFLYTYIPVWCESSGYADEVIEELHHTDYAMLARLEGGSPDESISWRQIPENVHLVDPHWKVSHSRPPGERLFRYNFNRLNSSADESLILGYIASALKIPIEKTGSLDGLNQPSNTNQSSTQGLRGLIQSKVAEYFSSYVQDVLEVAKKFDFEALDMFDLLEYYYHEWRQFHYHYYANLGGEWVPESIRRAALSPWEKNFLPVLQETDNRLTKAALIRLKQLRDHDLLSRNARDALNKFLESTIELKSTHDPNPASYYTAYVKGAVSQATIEYYTTEQSHMFLSDNTPLSDFKRVAARLSREQYLHYPGEFQSDMMQLCTDTLLKNHWEDLCREFVMHFTAGNYENLSWVLRATAWSVAATNQLLMIFKAYSKRMASDTFLSAEGDGAPFLRNPGTFEQDLVDILGQNLQLIEISLETDDAKYYVPDHYARKFRDGVEEVLEEIFSEHPQWRGPVGELWSQRARKAKEIRQRIRRGAVSYRGLYESDYETDSEEYDWEEPPDLDGEGSNLGQPSSSTHSEAFVSYEDDLDHRQFAHQPQPSDDLSIPPSHIHTPEADGGIVQLRAQTPGAVGGPVLEEGASYHNPADDGIWSLAVDIVDYFLRPWRYNG